MGTTFKFPTTVNARSIFLPYVLGLVAAMFVIHGVIWFRGNVPTAVDMILLGIVALGIMAWFWWRRYQLAKLRFGKFLAHAFAFVVITTSYNLHALAYVATLGAENQASDHAAQFLHAWLGSTIVMSTCWGLGLALHIVGVVVSRGWED